MKKILLSVSRLSNSKGIDFIIKALPQLVNLNKNVKLVIVGGGNEERYLKKDMSRFGDFRICNIYRSSFAG